MALIVDPDLIPQGALTTSTTAGFSGKSGDTITAVLTLNVGKGGMAIRAMTSLDTGTRVAVRFRLPRSQPDIEAISRVVWSDRESALGLQFEEVDTPDQSALDEFVDHNALP